MTAIFADTFYWIALTDFSDSFHGRALALTAEHASVSLVTTDEVLTEYLNYFAGRPETIRRHAAASVLRIIESPTFRVFSQSRASFLAGLELYAARFDKGYSLTDCISMQTMRREGLIDALTNDRHFEQEGFRALFRDVAKIG
ncbi:MAG: type II toxin-antitoxin system VapC family toxin [Bryobacteraceae bacterium]